MEFSKTSISTWENQNFTIPMSVVWKEAITDLKVDLTLSDGGLDIIETRLNEAGQALAALKDIKQVTAFNAGFR